MVPLLVLLLVCLSYAQPNNGTIDAEALTLYLAAKAAGDTCFKNYSTKNTCEDCVKNTNCVWCAATIYDLPACVQGNIIGPTTVSICTKSEEWYYVLCTVSGSQFTTNFTYVVIIALICIGVILIIILIGVLICCCCKERSKKIKKDRERARKELKKREEKEKDKEKYREMSKITGTSTTATNTGPRVTNTATTTTTLNTVKPTTTNKPAPQRLDSDIIIPLEDKESTDSVTEEIEVEDFDEIDDNPQPKSKNPKMNPRLTVSDEEAEFNELREAIKVTRSKMTEQEELCLAAMNYWSLNRMEQLLSPKFHRKILTQIMEDRVGYGGIFWNIDQLKATLTKIQNFIDMNDEMAFSVHDIIKFINKNIDIDPEVLTFITPAIVPHTIVTPHIDGPYALEQIIEMIKEAKDYIHVSVMLFFNDTAGQTIAQALIDAARDGVKVRIMFDKATTESDFFFGLLTKHLSLRGDFEQLAKRFKQVGIQLVRTDPEVFRENAWKDRIRPEREDAGVPELFLKVQDLIQRHLHESLNTVYHRKMMIIDDKVSFIGSINFGEEYLYEDDLKVIEGNPRGIPSNPKSWHDGLFVIEGEEFAKRLNTIFSQQWMVLGGDVFDLPEYPPETDNEEGEDISAIFYSFPGNPLNVTLSLYESLVTYSSGDIIIENPYILSTSFWETLSALPPEQAKKIRIVTSIKKTDHKFVPAAIKNNAEVPWKNGVRFYDYSECGVFSHWKILADSDAKVVLHGSTNLNTRSAIHDFEIDVLVKSPVVYKDVKQLLEFDVNVSRPLEYKDVDGNVLDKVVNELTVYFS